MHGHQNIKIRILITNLSTAACFDLCRSSYGYAIRMDMFALRYYDFYGNFKMIYTGRNM